MRRVPFHKLELTCATCGGAIERVRDGWVEWLRHVEGEREGQMSGFRLVHHGHRGACMYLGYGKKRPTGTMVGDHHLWAFLDVAGMMRLAASVARSKGADASFAELLLLLLRASESDWRKAVAAEGVSDDVVDNAWGAA